MRVDFAFGKTGLALDLPQGFRYQILEARSAEPLAHPTASIEQALDAPIAGPALVELATGKRSVAISVCDITRPAPNKQVLPHILKRLESAGIPKSSTTILIATGLHRPATEAEILEILGEEIARSCRVVNHNARELSEHRSLGATTSGTPVYIDERFVAAELHITLGFIEPHLMLGFSGGRKLIAPGLAAQETIKVLHGPKFMRDPRAVEGSIEDNPLHKELLEIARLARHDFMVDVALTRDRRIAGVFAGEAEKAHAAGMRFVSRVMLELLPEPVDAVITSCAGYPLDLTFYQAIKGITAAQHIVRKGGKILLVAACEEGPGAAEFCRMLKKSRSSEDFLAELAAAPVIIDQWQLEKLALVTRNCEILFHTPGLPAEYHEWLWGKAFPNIENAL
ncbi:MAG: nickel-dependent lactate racemase, partial [Bryobacteraceae bacterium]